jgi:hypothetical protein
MEGGYRPMTELERDDMNLEIKRIRLEEMGYILGNIPLDAAHGERIAERQQRDGFAHPLSRFRPRQQASAPSSNTSSSFSPPPEPSPPREGTANSGGLVQVMRLPARWYGRVLNRENRNSK